MKYQRVVWKSRTIESELELEGLVDHPTSEVPQTSVMVSEPYLQCSQLGGSAHGHPLISGHGSVWL